MNDTVMIDREYREATQAGADDRARSPVPATVRYEEASGRIVVDFTNGAAFLVPARSIQGLQEASVDQLREVERLGETSAGADSRDPTRRSPPPAPMARKAGGRARLTASALLVFGPLPQGGGDLPIALPGLSRC